MILITFEYFDGRTGDRQRLLKGRLLLLLTFSTLHLLVLAARCLDTPLDPENPPLPHTGHVLASTSGAKGALEGGKGALEGAKGALEGAKEALEGGKGALEGGREALDGGKGALEGGGDFLVGAGFSLASSFLGEGGGFSLGFTGVSPVRSITSLSSSSTQLLLLPVSRST